MSYGSFSINLVDFKVFLPLPVSLKFGGEVSRPSFGWSLSRYGRSATSAFTIGRRSCQWHLRRQSWTRLVLGACRLPSSCPPSWRVASEAVLIFVSSFVVVCFVLWAYICNART
jgi:hypothetical protein